MKHVDMKMILDRAYEQTLAMWNHEQEILANNPNNSIAQHKSQTYWKQAEEMHGMILAEQRKIEKLRTKQAK